MTMSATDTASTHSALSPMREALARHLPEMLALGEDELLPVNLDVLQASITVRGRWPEISSYRAQIAKQLPDFDLGPFDRLESYALAAAQAHVDEASSRLTNEQLAALNGRGLELRELLNTDIKALVLRKLVDAESISKLRMQVGYQNVAFDLLLLANVFRQNWNTISGKTGATADELAEAETVANRLMAEVGRKEQGHVATSEAGARRQRAFTLMLNAYDDARRAITFLRWKHGDADRIAPSLYAGRGHAKGDKDEASPDKPADEAPAGGAPAHPAPSGGPAPAGPKVPGGPGGNPFVG